MQDAEPNPLTKLLPIGVGAFGWQVHGLLVGLTLAVVYVGIVIASNAQVMANAPDDWVSRIQSRKWIIFALFMVGISISGARVVSF